jgi:hypothetical protein
MKFGVREICDVVLKAKAAQKVGNKIFYKDEPVIYFDTLKTSSMEGAATTVYAQGGRGNSRLVAWEGERTITFTMEDALISPAGFMILSGAGLVEASESKTLKVHQTEQTAEVNVEYTGEIGAEDYAVSSVSIDLKKKPFVDLNKPQENFIYVMLLDADGQVSTEPFIPARGNKDAEGADAKAGIEVIKNAETGEEFYRVSLSADDDLDGFVPGCVVLVDYYSEESGKTQQIEITPDKFGGNYYLEAATLFRDTRGVDMPAEFIIPNCKIQSNFNFTMASSGDPSTFTFTMDAFPDYTRFDNTKKVLAAIQIVETAGSSDIVRDRTWSANGYRFN